MPLSSWLFIRGSESIWIERLEGSTLIVAGPDPHQERRDFIDDDALNAFQVEFAQKLAADGWFLWPYPRDRRSGVERRRRLRGTTERRQPTRLAQ